MQKTKLVIACTISKMNIIYWVAEYHVLCIKFTPVVSQSYTANVWEEHVIRGNSALMKCNLPAFVGDFVTVSAWFQDDVRIMKNDVYGRYFS